MKRDTIGIIGGGLGGLSAAIHLARAKFRVIVFEKEAHLGGKMGEFEAAGYRFGTGPSLLTLPTVLADLCKVGGTTLEAEFSLEKLDPICRYFFYDGSSIDAVHDQKRFQSELKKISPDDAAQLPRFMAYCARIYKRGAPTFMFRSFRDPRSFLNWGGLRHLPFLYQLDPFRTVHQAICSFFKSTKVQQLFGRYATYSGSDPYKAPATLNIIPHVEYILGSYYVRGGLYRIPEQLKKIAENLGVEFRTDSEVTEISHSNGAVTGVVVKNDEFVPCNGVVSNADVVWTFTKLLKGFPEKEATLVAQEPSCSGLVFMWGIARPHPALSHHNIFFSKDYQDEFKAIFELREIPEHPTVYISISSKSDAAHAPAGHENWFVLVNMPYLSDKFKWSAEKISQVRRAIFKLLEHHGIRDLEEVLTFERTTSPQDFYNRTYSNCGSIYGISSNSRDAAFQRQANRSREVRGLYFAGGSVHPGGGIPMVLLSGKHAASLVERYHT